MDFRPTGFRLLPDVVKNLLIINGIMFLATMALGSSFNIDLRDILGLHYFDSEKFHPYQLITYMFMHGDFTHLFFNMFAVWMFGNAIENVWGANRFLIFYLVTGLGAAVLHYIVVYIQIQPEIAQLSAYILNPDANSLTAIVNDFNESMSYLRIHSQEINNAIPTFNRALNVLQHNPNDAAALNDTVNFVRIYLEEFKNGPNVVGASGSLFGLLLAFGMLFPNSLIFISFIFPIKAKYFVLFYGAIEIFYAVQNNPGDNVAHFAHLGGMIFGYILIKYWRKRGFY